MNTEHPTLPYPGEPPTQGWSGSTASRDRAEIEALDGTVTRRQRQALELLRLRADRGVTVVEFRHETGLHHGQASSVLSVLHKVGRIARLTERRDRASIYVLPEYVGGRETARRATNKRVTIDEYLEALADAERLAQALRDLMSAATRNEPDIAVAFERADRALAKHDEEESADA